MVKAFKVKVKSIQALVIIMVNTAKARVKDLEVIVQTIKVMVKALKVMVKVINIIFNARPR